MKTKAKLTTITITLGEREFVLTEDEAKALRGELNNLFGEPVTTIINNNTLRETVERPYPHRWPHFREIWAKAEATKRLSVAQDDDYGHPKGSLLMRAGFGGM